jgi:tRNA A-37 threonylcarbamoyl transferase component Bud32
MSDKRIGRYLAEKVLGAGAFATVWLAYDETLETRVAIKVLADNWARNAGIRQRFIEEARILRRIDHDRIIRVHEINELDDGRPYIVMALADRGTLENRIDELGQEGRLPIGEAIRLTIELCEALSVVHDFGVVHRDIKPSNMLFREVRPHERSAAKRLGIDLGDEVVVLGDFGLAKDVSGGDGFTVAAGTPAYMAPEQAQAAADIDNRVDVFAATAVLYELIAGRTAFASESLSGVRRSRENLQFAALSSVRPETPVALDHIVERGLAANREDRYPTVTALADALEAFRRDYPDLVRDRAGAGPARAPERIVEHSVIQGSTRRVLDLIPVFEPRLTAEGLAALASAELRLTRPVTVVVVDTVGSGRVPVLEGTDTVTVSALDDPAVFSADAVAVVMDTAHPEARAALGALVGELQSAPAGPLVVQVLVASSEAGPSVESFIADLRSSARGSSSLVTALGDNEIESFVALVRDLADHRAPSLRSAAGLRLLYEVAEQANSPADRSHLLQAVDLVRAELPELDELEVLRGLANGRTSLPISLRDDVVALLGFADPARRLRQVRGADRAQLVEVAEELGTRWRVLENTGRIPFSARRAMLTAQQALDRLHADLTRDAN